MKSQLVLLICLIYCFIRVSGLEYGIVEWKMEWNSEYTQLQLGTVQSSLSYLLISRALTSL